MKFHKIYDDAQKEIERLKIDNSKKTINNNFKLFVNSIKHFNRYEEFKNEINGKSIDIRRISKKK